MSTAVSTEMRKFFSTRLWWVLLLVMAGYMAFLAAVLAFSLVESPEQPTVEPLDLVRSIYTVATSLGYVFPAIVGTLAVTSEFRHRTIVPTLLADPSRTRLITAKMIAAASGRRSGFPAITMLEFFICGFPLWKLRFRQARAAQDRHLPTAPKAPSKKMPQTRACP